MNRRTEMEKAAFRGSAPRYGPKTPLGAVERITEKALVEGFESARERLAFELAVTEFRETYTLDTDSGIGVSFPNFARAMKAWENIPNLEGKYAFWKLSMIIHFLREITTERDRNHIDR